MKPLLTAALLCLSLPALAGPKGAPPPPPAANEEGPRRGDRDRRMHTMLVVGIAEALQLNEAEALRLSDKLKGFEERRRPIRDGMAESMRTLKAAADGDPAALPQVDAAMQRVLDGRQQMAALDKEMFGAVAKELSPQRRAQLALFFARFAGKGPGGHEFGRGQRGGSEE